MMKPIRAVADAFETAASYLAGGLVLAALFSISAQILFRYGLRNSLSWSEEFARYALIFATMVGAAVAYRRGAHVAMTMLTERLPEKIHIWLWRATHLGVVALCLLISFQGWMIAMRNLERQQTSPALQIDIGWIYMAIPLGAVLIMLAALEACFTRPKTALARESAP